MRKDVRFCGVLHFARHVVLGRVTFFFRKTRTRRVGVGAGRPRFLLAQRPSTVLHERLVDALGADAVKTAPEDLRAYSFDAYTEGRLPAAVVLPASTRDVSAVVKIAREFGEPIVPRGAGTGLCGGAVPTDGGIVISFARMNRILELDVRNRRARVQPGLINLDLSRAIARDGIFYAPDPSSQKISTIGGNVGTNAGGPHCLSYGTTINHVLGLEIVDERARSSHTELDDPGYDLTARSSAAKERSGSSPRVGSPAAPARSGPRVARAAFGDVESASEAVSAIIAAGIVPTALEIMDADHRAPSKPPTMPAIRPTPAPSCWSRSRARRRHGRRREPRSRESRASTARSRGARSRASRNAKRSGRRARAPPARWAHLAQTTTFKTRACRAASSRKRCTRSNGSRRAYDLPSATSFTPATATCTRCYASTGASASRSRAVDRSRQRDFAHGIEMGGTISGEHGIGYEKRDAMTAVFTTEDLAAMARVRDVFDPRSAFNPEKIFPAGVRARRSRRSHEDRSHRRASCDLHARASRGGRQRGQYIARHGTYAAACRRDALDHRTQRDR